MSKAAAPGYYRVMLGDFEITAISDGTVALPVDKLLTNTTPEQTLKTLAKNYLSSPLQNLCERLFDQHWQQISLDRYRCWRTVRPNIGTFSSEFEGGWLYPRPNRRNLYYAHAR